MDRNECAEFMAHTARMSGVVSEKDRGWVCSNETCKSCGNGIDYSVCCACGKDAESIEPGTHSARSMKYYFSKVLI